MIYEFDVTIFQRVSIDTNKISKKWKDFLDAWMTDDDDRTDEQWDILENHELREMFKDLGYNVTDEIDLWDTHD